ncbi:PREDICTED: uncharacterized protein KIAA2026-like [Priapulus caudatus]|uniref:Uncharacterized protein KIAA2026-like n=1 Tax=Priapulus caudatus TaxID=37621 RepID=A0ABM1ESH6_PRICU|nr:PREDICTED: uncharacterized protein KIAA2026-like [Priapulus caudatus]
MLSLRSEQRTGTAAYLAFTRPTYFYAGIIKEQRSKMEKDEDSIVGTYMPSSSSSNFDVDVIKVETSTAVIDAELGVGIKPKSQLMLPSSDKKQGSRASRCTRTVPTPGDRIQADVTAVVKRLVRSVEAKQQHDADEVVRLKLSEELQQGYRILKEFMSDVNKSVNRLFMDEVDVEELQLWDYHERVKDPIWLKKMKQKFDDFTYQSITDFVADFRRMVENCLRYNGPDHVISKKANRLNTMLEQKLALLSWHVREKTSLEATSAVYGSTSPKLSSCGFTGTRKRKVIVPNDNSHLVQQLREEEREKKKQQRLQTMEEKRKATEAAEQEALDWDNNLLKEPIRMQMMTCWELPQICHFFYLTQEALNMPLLNTYELERCLAMPRESSMLAMIMTTLLCSPSQRPKLDRKPPMPYRIWSKRLKKRVAQWYKMLCEKGYDIEKVCTKFGFDTKLFDVLGECDPLEEQEFHELNYIERVWIVKSLCDYCLVSRLLLFS